MVSTDVKSVIERILILNIEWFYRYVWTIVPNAVVACLNDCFM